MRVRGFQNRRSAAVRSALVMRTVIAAALATGGLFVSESGVQAATVTVAASDCQRLVRHQPDADVAYKPGVDATGKPVVPADLPGSVKIKTPTEVTFDVTYDLLSNYGAGADSVLAPRGEASVGKVKYDLLSGALTFNGERIDDAEMAALSDLCKAAATP